MWRMSLQTLHAKMLDARDIRHEELRKNPDSQFLLGAYAQIQACLLMVEDLLEQGYKIESRCAVAADSGGDDQGQTPGVGEALRGKGKSLDVHPMDA